MPNAIFRNRRGSYTYASTFYPGDAMGSIGKPIYPSVTIVDESANVNTEYIYVREHATCQSQSGRMAWEGSSDISPNGGP